MYPDSSFGDGCGEYGLGIGPGQPGGRPKPRVKMFRGGPSPVLRMKPRVLRQRSSPVSDPNFQCPPGTRGVALGSRSGRCVPMVVVVRPDLISATSRAGPELTRGGRLQRAAATRARVAAARKRLAQRRAAAQRGRLAPPKAFERPKYLPPGGYPVLKRKGKFFKFPIRGGTYRILPPPPPIMVAPPKRKVPDVSRPTAKFIPTAAQPVGAKPLAPPIGPTVKAIDSVSETGPSRIGKRGALPKSLREREAAPAAAGIAGMGMLPLVAIGALAFFMLRKK